MTRGPRASIRASYVQPDLTLFGDEHVRRYARPTARWATSGTAPPCLVLTTTGGKSGAATTVGADLRPRRRRLRRDRPRKGGAPTHPNWYLNLNANPDVEVQVRATGSGAKARTARARRADAAVEAHDRRSWPNYDVYKTRTDRVIPVVVLEPDRSGT